MPERAAIKIEGLSLFQRKLKALDAEAPKMLKTVQLAAAESALASILPLVPVGTGALGNETGALRASVRAGASRRSGYVKVGSAKVPYAGPIQFGWPAHNIEPQDFLYSGMLRAEPAIVREFVTGLAALLRTVGVA